MLTFRATITILTCDCPLVRVTNQEPITLTNIFHIFMSLFRSLMKSNSFDMFTPIDVEIAKICMIK
jgi:hypothetical protein